MSVCASALIYIYVYAYRYSLFSQSPAVHPDHSVKPKKKKIPTIIFTSKFNFLNFILALNN